MPHDLQSEPAAIVGPESHPANDQRCGNLFSKVHEVKGKKGRVPTVYERFYVRL